MFQDLKIFFVIFGFLLYISSWLAAIHVLWNGRTAQGTIAWFISLITFPLISLPLYLIFGHSKFDEYIEARQIISEKADELTKDLLAKYVPEYNQTNNISYSNRILIDNIFKLSSTRGNSWKILKDGHKTFSEIFQAVEHAEKYILIQYFILKNDDIGKKLQELLIKKAKQGVKIYMLIDAIGSFKLDNSYIKKLKDNGIIFSWFRNNHKNYTTKKRFFSRFNINFRNHRKIVIVDGKTAFTGGLNVGDEYLSNTKKFKVWRDTHIKISGPAVISLLLSFNTDWLWSTDQLLDIPWEPQPSDHNYVITVMPTGPDDEMENCSLFFLNAIFSATKRIWITTPYFSPDRYILYALNAAALRGVDVRILLPNKIDHYSTHFATCYYIERSEDIDIKYYRYTPGFLHEKVMLIDDAIATIGSVNFDQRSFHLNFELTVMSPEKDFIKSVESMLEEDFKNSHSVSAEDYHKRSFLFKLAMHLARLFAPIL